MDGRVCDFTSFLTGWMEGFAILRPYVLFNRMDGRVCDFTSFLTVFQSYQDDVWMIMKGSVQ